VLIRLAHVCIETTDLAATERFYELLGAKRQFEFRNFQDELIGMYLYFGEDTFIEVVLIGASKPDGGALVHFALELDDIDTLVVKLNAAGVATSEKELGADHTWMATCHDPNGIFIEFHQYTHQSLQKTGGMCRLDYTP
jgi:glyoxylase I family protein